MLGWLPKLSQYCPLEYCPLVLRTTSQARGRPFPHLQLKRSKDGTRSPKLWAFSGSPCMQAYICLQLPEDIFSIAGDIALLYEGNINALHVHTARDKKSPQAHLYNVHVT